MIRGKKLILVIIDLFTKYVKIYPSERTNVEEIKKCLENYVTEVGKPKRMITDNATYSIDLNLFVKNIIY